MDAFVDGDRTLVRGTAQAALRHREFRIVWSGMFASNIGTWMQNVLLGAYGFTLTHSETYVAILFFAQLALNFAWSPIFFAAHAIQPALVVIVVMVGLAALAAGQFRRIRPLAGYLMLPYLLWLCFAASLNSAIGRLNPEAGSSRLG